MLMALTPNRTYEISDSLDYYIKETNLGGVSTRAISHFIPLNRCEEVRLLVDECLRHTKSIKLLDYSDTRCPGYQWLELVHSGIGKQAAVGRLLHRQMIDKPLIGLGNGSNYLDFLKLCDYAICPADATPAVLAIANEVAPVAGGKEFCIWISSRLSSICSTLTTT